MLHAAPSLAWHESNYETRKQCEEEVRKVHGAIFAYSPATFWQSPAMGYRASHTLYVTVMYFGDRWCPGRSRWALVAMPFYTTAASGVFTENLDSWIR